MPLFSQRSKSVLNTATVGLQVLFNRVIQRRDCTVLPDGGKRTIERQKQLMEAGSSKVGDPLKSAHVPKNSQGEYDPEMLSEAVDVFLYQPDKPEYNGLDWRSDKELWKAIENGNLDEAAEILENIKRLHNFTGYVMGVADTLGVPVRNGQDWDGDGEFDDQKFNDTPHWEMTGRR